MRINNRNPYSPLFYYFILIVFNDDRRFAFVLLNSDKSTTDADAITEATQ